MPPPRRETIAHQIAYTATSVGYAAASVALNFGMIGGLQALLAQQEDVDDEARRNLAFAAAAGVVKMAFSVPVQVLAGYMIGLNTTRRLPFKKVGLEPFLLRSALAVLS